MGTHRTIAEDGGQFRPGRAAPAVLARGRPDRGIREQRKGLVLGNHPRRHALLHQRQRRQRAGTGAGDLLERPFTDLISSETADGSATSERTLGFYLSSHVAFQDLIVRAKTKNEIWWSISGRPVHDEVGRFFGFRGFASDLTKMRQSEVELDRLARQDSLTGLANREALRRALDDALVSAVRRKHRCSVFLLDLDRFKAVNDTLGHPAGDTLLRLVALRLRDVVGELGQVGRLGGDEFEVVLPTHLDKAELSRAGAGHHRQPVAALHDQRHRGVDRRVGRHRHVGL